MGGQPGSAVVNRSLSSGLDQYDLRGPNAGGKGQGQGPFRGAFNAGNVLYASLTQSDQFATVVFADSARREMAAVFDPGTPASPGVARQAFQVQRDGHITVTGRTATRFAIGSST